MTCISFKQIHEGRSASDNMDDKGKYVATTVQVWRAETDNNDDSEYDIALHDDCPNIGTELIKSVLIDGDWTEVHTDQYLTNRQFSNQSFAKRVWHVTLTYSSNNYEANPSDPLLTATRISWRSEQFQKPAVKDAYGRAIVNSAGDPYDPPVERDDSRWVATVVKNLAAVPIWLLDYQDAVNELPFTIDGLLVDARKAKIQDIQISDWLHQNNVAYRQVTVSIAFVYDTFDLQVLDAGFNKLDTSNLAQVHEYDDLEMMGQYYIHSNERPFQAADVGYILQITSGVGFAVGQYVIMNVFSGIAQVAAIAGITGSTNGHGFLWNSNYIKQRILIPDDKNELAEPASPVLLNGAGQPITNTSVLNAVFNSYRVYKERDFNLLPFFLVPEA